MGTHPIFESDFDCLTEMKLLILLKLSSVLYGDKRLERKEINPAKLDKEYEEDDDVELEDLEFHDPRKPKQGMDISKLDGRDHVTTWSQSKKGQQFGLYVNVVEGLSENDREELFDVWQMNMINCCNFELTFLPLEQGQMLVLLPDGKFLMDFATMLRKDKRCFTFVVENTQMLCGGHPKYDPKRPGLNVEGFHWDKVHAAEDAQKRRDKVEMWKEGEEKRIKEKVIGSRSTEL